MKTSIKVLGVIAVILVSLTLFKFVHIIIGITFFIIGIGLLVYFGFIRKTSYNFPKDYQLYNISINDISKSLDINDGLYVREPVPKKVYRTWCVSTPVGICGGRNAIISAITLTEQNLPDWEHIIYGDKEVDEFLEKEFGKENIITKAYYLINPKYGAARADLFRYLIIYKYGGLYLDMKSYVKNPLPQLPDDMDMWVSGWDFENPPHINLFPSTGEYQNWYIYARKGAPVLKNIIEKIVTNIYDLHINPNKIVDISDSLHSKTISKGTVLSVTGPIAMTIAIIESKNNKSVYYNNIINNSLYYNYDKNNTILDGHYSLITEELIKPYINVDYIPKTVYIYYHDLDLIPQYMKDNIDEYCSGYDIKFYDNKMCVDFLNKYYGKEAVDLFNNIKYESTKIDFWKYCILFVFGGYYFDSKTYFNKHINQVFNSKVHNTWYLALSSNKSSIYNGIIVTSPKNPILLKVIKRIYKNPNKSDDLYKTFIKNLTNMLTIGNNAQENSWNCVLLRKECSNKNNTCVIKNIEGEILFTEYSKTIKTYISITTIPERLINEWFFTNLKRTLSLLADNQILILNVPQISLKGEKYIIPDNVNNLQGPRFIINKCGKDEGPITKLLPSLRNTKIKDDDILMVFDDDIVYRKNVFKLLENSVLDKNTYVTVMCNQNIEGFKGFAFFKKLLKGILNISIPKSCIRIDDDVINWYAKEKGIKIHIIPYKGDNNSYCSMHKDRTGTHPTWDELNRDNRTPMIVKCIKDIAKANTTTTIENFSLTESGNILPFLTKKERVNYYIGSLIYSDAIINSTIEQTFNGKFVDFNDDNVYKKELQYIKELCKIDRKLPIVNGDNYNNFDWNAFSKTRPIMNNKKLSNLVLLPLNSYRHFGFARQIMERKANELQFDKKSDLLVWRGVSTGSITDAHSRFRLVEKYFNESWCDIGFVPCKDRYKKTIRNLIKNKIDETDLLNHKYLLSIEGNDVASNLKWMLASNSVVLSPPFTIESWYMEGKLIPYIHYVPISSDFEDLQEKYNWCVDNPEKCKIISKNATEFINCFMNKDFEDEVIIDVVNTFISKIKDGNLPSCFITKHVDKGEREVADKFTMPDACVLEFGGGSGAVSTIIQKRLNKKGNHVVIHPNNDDQMFGGVASLLKNKKSCNSEYHIIDYILKKGDGKNLLKLVSKPFDTLVVDCEKCLVGEYEKNPDLFDNIDMIQVERDDYKKSYDDLFAKLKLSKIHIGLGCGGMCKTEVWVRNKYKNLKGDLNEKHFPNDKKSNLLGIIILGIIILGIIILGIIILLWRYLKFSKK